MSDDTRLEVYIQELEQLLSEIENDESIDIETMLDKMDYAVNIIEKCDLKMKAVELRVNEIKQRLNKETDKK